MADEKEQPGDGDEKLPSSVRIRDDELTKLYDEMKKMIEKIDKSKRKQQELDLLQDKCTSFQTAMEAFQLELKDLPPGAKRKAKSKLKAHKANYDEIKNQIEWKRTENTKDALVGDREVKVVDYNTEEGLVKHGDELLDESKKSLQNSVTTVANTVVLARETAQKIAEQTDMMTKIYDDLKSVEGTLARSREIMKRIARKIATDKYIWVLTFLVFMAIVGIIIYKVLHPNDTNFYVPDAVTNGINSLTAYRTCVISQLCSNQGTGGGGA